VRGHSLLEGGGGRGAFTLAQACTALRSRRNRVDGWRWGRYDMCTDVPLLEDARYVPWVVLGCTL
jgi:hypothetical protein